MMEHIKGVDHNYTNNGDDTVTDNVTGLMWQDNSDVADEDIELDWESVKTYCSDLKLAGHDDWELPTVNDLLYITDKGRSNPAIDTTKFNHVASSYYWSSTTYASDSSNAWIVNFNYSSDYHSDKPNSNFVRCVRAGE